MPLENNPTRRQFSKTAAGTAIGAATINTLTSARGQDAPSQKLIVGIMGLGRGRGHIKGWLQVPGVEIAYLCDVDSKRHEEAAGVLKRSGQEQPAKFVTDFRKILEDPQVDIISIAAPNYWHAPATILACKAGKHVYVEKPGSHNGREGELMVEAARKYDRKVQMGNQRRSYPSMIEGIQKLQDGVIGKPIYGRSYYINQRPSIGIGKPAEPPQNLNYDLWLGPCPEYAFKDNLVHYNWHWHWHFGGGEMANNGVHSLDVVRWGLGVDTPKTVSFQGNRYHHEDNQETPDTGTALFDFGEVGASWEQSSCHRRKPESHPFASWSCEKGFASCDGSGITFYDLQGKEVDKQPRVGGDQYHFQNLADAIRADVPLHSEIGDAQKSSRWCHLANIALKTRQVLEIDPETGRPVDEKAMEHWSREYRDGWSPTV
tara:strand:- start:5211 stop:6500 length:1290 start_codon:yes stop_codon:yes gene_type:complete